MASGGMAGVGTDFLRWGGAALTRDTIDMTSLDSTDKYREFIAGFRNAGTVGLAMIFTRVMYETMKDDYESDTLQNYSIVLPDAETTSLEFEGLVTELPLTVPAEDKITIDVTIQISGAVTVNSGSAQA